MSFKEIGTQIGELVEEKQIAYGDSFSKSGDILRILYPNGISSENMNDALVLVRIVDKMFRIATHGSNNDSMGEEPWKDIAGYAILAVGKCEKDKTGATKKDKIIDNEYKYIDAHGEFTGVIASPYYVMSKSEALRRHGNKIKEVNFRKADCCNICGNMLGCKLHIGDFERFYVCDNFKKDKMHED